MWLRPPRGRGIDSSSRLAALRIPCSADVGMAIWLPRLFPHPETGGASGVVLEARGGRRRPAIPAGYAIASQFEGLMWHEASSGSAFDTDPGVVTIPDTFVIRQVTAVNLSTLLAGG